MPASQQFPLEQNIKHLTWKTAQQLEPQNDLKLSWIENSESIIFEREDVMRK
jgi:hypothetical protein